MKFIHVHIPKTAGTKVKTTITNVLKSSGIVYPVELHPEGYCMELMYYTDGELNRYDLITGHFGFGVVNRVSDEFRSVVFFREPAERILSLFHHWQKLFGNMYSDMDINDFLSCSNQSVMENTDNAQAWQMIHGYDKNSRNKFSGLSKKELLSKAKKNIDRIDFVGIQEEMPLSMQKFSDKFGVKTIKKADEVVQPGCFNATQKAHVDIDELRQKFSFLIDMDTELYEYAKTRLLKS